VADNADLSFAVLGHLYALAAARLNGDLEAVELIRDEVRPMHASVMPEAAVAVAYTTIRQADGDARVLDEAPLRGLTDPVKRALTHVLEGWPPEFITLEAEDPVETAIRTVVATWLWACDGDADAAATMARTYCARLVLYRERPDRD